MQGARRKPRQGARVQRPGGSPFGGRRGPAPIRRKRRKAHSLKRWTLRHPWLYGGIKFSLLAAIWVWEVFVVDSERIKALLGHGG